MTGRVVRDSQLGHRLLAGHAGTGLVGWLHRHSPATAVGSPTKGAAMARPSNPRSRNHAVRSRNDALVRIRRTTVAMGLTATVAAVGIGVAVAGAATHHATSTTSTTTGSTGTTSTTATTPGTTGTTASTATAATTTPSTTTTTTKPAATTTSGQS